MKRILMVVNTYFQLIVSINLKLNKFINDDVDIMITDRTMGSKEIVKNVKKTKLFSNVYHADTYHIWREKSAFLMIIDLLYLKKDSVVRKSVYIDNPKYDELYLYNYDVFTFTLYNYLKKQNDKLTVSRFEEGFGSYLYDDKKLKGHHLRKIVRKVMLRYNLENNVKEYYFFNPDMVVYNEKAELKKINNIDKSNKTLVNALNTTFNYNPNKNEYKQKYIFFEESFFCDNKGIEDLDLILKIADIVGKDNLLVKLHPRNRVDRFKEYGITTNKTVGIPWEVIQMNNDFSDKVFLTISSGSVLASKLYFGDNIKTYLLFNCTDKMSDMVTEETFEYLKKMNEKFDMKDFIIPKNKEEFFSILEKDSTK